MSEAASRVDLRGCEREPIHIPGAVQPHGVLLVVDEPELIVTQVSDNLLEFMGSSVNEALGRPLDSLLTPSSVERVRAALLHANCEDMNPLRLSSTSRAFHGLVHRCQGATMLELEPPPARSWSRDHHPLRQALNVIQRARTLAELCQSTVVEVRRITGFERVMLYRFDDAGNGSVDAEARESHLESYLGLHYPASDIPRQARQLYLNNWLRVIPDSRYTPARVVPSRRPDTGAPLDLSHAVLRSVSPVHLEYLQNMGVCASMSVSLIVNERLWGLISCAHHSASRFVAYEVRAACEVIGRLVSLQLAALEDRHVATERAARSGAHQRLARAMREAGNDASVLSALCSCPQDVLELVQASGVAIIEEDEVRTLGETPEPDFIRQLSSWLDGQYLDEPFAVASLAQLNPAAHEVAGVASGLLTFTLPPTPERRILWFRPEVTKTIHWGGDPNKAVSVDASQRLHPRRSFELWKQQVRCCARAWSAPDLEAAQELRRRALEIDLERQVHRERKAVRARDDVVAVVSHDLKSPLGVIQTQAELLRAITARGSLSASHVETGAERIQRAVERMNHLIHDLLDQAAIEAGRLTLSRQSEQVEALVGEALRLLRSLADAKQVSVEARLVELPPVPLDRERFFQVLSNVIGNAIKFSPVGGVVIVEARRADRELELAVRDDGPGISPERLPHIFDRYWQATETANQGSGLGLYIARGIVEAHGGRIWAESPLGSGAVIKFTLPLESPSAA